MASNNKNRYPVDQMLNDIHLEMYHTLFRILGYRTVSDCAQLNHEILQEMGVSLTGHRKRILRKIQEELEKECGDLEDFSTEKLKTSNGILSIDVRDRTMLGKEFIAIDSELNNLPMKHSTTTAVDCGMPSINSDGVSWILKHNGQEKSPESSGESYDKMLDYNEIQDSGNFFEFQGPMIENELYKEMNHNDTKKTQVKTRSFILRNRPVPDLPVSANNSSYNFYPKGTRTIDASPGGKLTQNLPKEQSVDENILPISPYEETFFFRQSENTKKSLKALRCMDGYCPVHSMLPEMLPHINKNSKLKFVHTSVHGVGHDFVQSAFQAFSFSPPLAVPEQKDPDPEFTTVKYPNPEEGKGVLKLSFELADKEEAKIILANDPDADRLAVAEKQESGDWKVFSGNELGALLGWWIFTCWKEKNPDPSAVKNVYMLASTVSSKILRAVAVQEGFHFEETLTGFKWMGNRAKELIDQGKSVLFAFEEAIGYMCCPLVLDKDGVSAAVITAEMASYLATKNLTLSQQLEAIFNKYGYHISRNSYFLCYDQTTIRNLFANLRNYDGDSKYPKLCGKFEVTGVRDLTTGFDDNQPDNKAILPTSKSSQMITFTFANGGVATMRTSGTEPKIKYYAELCAAPGNSDYNQLKKELNDLADAIEEHFFQPEKNKLQRKTD